MHLCTKKINVSESGSFRSFQFWVCCYSLICRVVNPTYRDEELMGRKILCLRFGRSIFIFALLSSSVLHCQLPMSDSSSLSSFCLFDMLHLQAFLGNRGLLCDCWMSVRVELKWRISFRADSIFLLLYVSLPASGSNQHVISEYAFPAMNTQLLSISKVALNRLT